VGDVGVCVCVHLCGCLGGVQVSGVGWERFFICGYMCVCVCFCVRASVWKLGEGGHCRPGRGCFMRFNSARSSVSMKRCPKAQNAQS